MAQTDYYLQIEGLEGQCEDPKGAIEIESFGISESQPGGHGWGGNGKVSIQDFNFSTKVSKACVKLFYHCADGKRFDKALLVCRKAVGGDQQDYLKWTLNGVYIASYSQSATAGSGTEPIANFTLKFEDVDMEHRVYDKGKAQGWIKNGYDVKNAKPKK